MDEHNPYAAPVEAPNATTGELLLADNIDYEAERRSVLVCVVLSFITLGIYQAVWLYRRRPFLDSLRAKEKLGTVLPALVLTVMALNLLGMVPALEPLGRTTGLIAGCAMVASCFRVKAILQAELIQIGAPEKLSGAATFFFGIMYLQHRLNRLADVAATVPPPAPPKKKKKKKKRQEEPAFVPQ